MLSSILISITLVAAGAVFAAKQSRTAHALSFGFSTLVLGVAVTLSFFALTGFVAGVQAPLWYIDPFAGLMIAIIGIVQWGATLASIPYLKEEEREGVISLGHVRRYYFLMYLFVASMFTTVMADNLGLMWIALEATTLATTLLVAFYRKEGSLEAAWKYLILCSTGLALGLLGFLILYAAATESGLGAAAASSVSGLLALGGAIPTETLKIAFLLVFIGFGTKVGLAPMHTWLPDAHSRAPAPISGLLSGVVLNVALFSVLRYKGIVDGSFGSSDWTNMLFVVFGALSIVVPAAFILIQADYKRLLAYSSIEHMGLVVFAWGLGGLGIAASLIHMLGHALSKSMLFFGAGNILLHFKSTKFETVGSIKRYLPYTRALFVFGVFALLAFPPSPLFFSEYLIILAAVKTHPVFLAVVLVALTTILAGFLRNFMPMLFEQSDAIDVKVHEKWNLSHVAMAFQLTIAVGIGVVLWTDIGRETLMRITDFSTLV